MAARWSEAGRAVRGGAIAGVMAGVVLAVFGMLVSALKGHDIWVVAKMAAAPLFGERALQPGFELAPALLGLVGHLGVSVAWGVLYGLLAYGLREAASLALGAAFGLAAWFVMFHVVLPLLGLTRVAARAAVGALVFEHLLFGVSLAIAFLPYHVPRRRASRLQRRRAQLAAGGKT